jgi:hypothetical protein
LFFSPEFGAGAYHGMEFEVGAKLLEMKAFASIAPYGGIYAWGSLGLCWGTLCGTLRLDGYIMDLRFPSTAEICFSKFPLDVRLVLL